MDRIRSQLHVSNLLICKLVISYQTAPEAEGLRQRLLSPTLLYLNIIVFFEPLNRFLDFKDLRLHKGKERSAIEEVNSVSTF